MNHSTQPTFPGATLRPALLLLAAGLTASPLRAQPAPPAPGLGLSELSAAYSFSTAGDIERNGKLGRVEVSHFEFETSFTLPAPETWIFSSALSWKRDEFELTGSVPLPAKLEEIGLSFMAMKDLSHAIGPGWSATTMLSPSFASDDGDVSSDSLNVFAMAVIGKEVSPNFSWNAGVVGMNRGDMKVIPMLGLRWSFARDWELEFGFPRTGVSYKFSNALTLRSGVAMQGGTYYVKKAPAAGLGHTYLDYREIRIGLTAEYEFSPHLSVVIDGGLTLDRTFDYYDRGVKLDGKSATYGRFGLRYRF